jgi:hypothetical protein
MRRVAETGGSKMQALMSAITRLISTAILAAGMLATAAAVAFAAEPRPWLCRDKPVFSSSGPMTYDASMRGGGHWVMTFMRFDPSGGHDGFTVFDSREVSGQVSGTLERGQWYAVGMYREEGRWVCAGPAQENHQFVAGIVRDLCYGRADGGCDVKMIVRESRQGAAAH